MAAKNADALILVGELCKEAGVGAVKAGMPAEAIACVDSHEDAIELLRDLIQPGARILVKGSRGMQMEKVSSALIKMPMSKEG